MVFFIFERQNPDIKRRVPQWVNPDRARNNVVEVSRNERRLFNDPVILSEASTYVSEKTVEELWKLFDTNVLLLSLMAVFLLPRRTRNVIKLTLR